MWPFSKRNKQRKAREIAATAHICDNPLRAHSVREEYLYLSRRLCKCGGDLETLDHALRYHKGQPRDVIQVTCLRCRSFYCFVFDISHFFGKEPPDIDKHVHSSLLDVMDWSHHGYTCLHLSDHAPAAREDQLLQDSVWAFEEMLKFYPANGNYPFPDAFFNHKALPYSTLRKRYPRALLSHAMRTARARLGK